MSAALYDRLPTRHHRHHHHDAAQEGHPPLLDEGADAARWLGGRAHRRPGLHLRFVPVREDLATPESWAKPISTRGAIEAMPEGCIAVADAMGVTTAGIFGDILTMRMMKRNVTALVTDGVDPRQGRRAGLEAADLVRGRRGAGVGQRADLRRLERADRLRRLRDLSRRHHRLRRRRRGGDPAGPARRSSPRKAPSTSCMETWIVSEVEKARSCPASIR